MNKEETLIWLICVLVFAVPVRSQKADDIENKEQSTFDAEEVPGIPLVKRPVPVPNAVLQILGEDVDVKGCLSSDLLPPNHSLASLFIGSEIHLDGPNERDLVVLPIPDSGCFQGATGIGTFWVFKASGERSKLVLKALGNGLEIAKNRYNGFRIIQTGTIGQSGKEYTTITFRFDGKTYQKYKESTRQQN